MHHCSGESPSPCGPAGENGLVLAMEAPTGPGRPARTRSALEVVIALPALVQGFFVGVVSNRRVKAAAFRLGRSRKLGAAVSCLVLLFRFTKDSFADQRSVLVSLHARAFSRAARRLVQPLCGCGVDYLRAWARHVGVAGFAVLRAPVSGLRMEARHE